MSARQKLAAPPMATTTAKGIACETETGSTTDGDNYSEGYRFPYDGRSIDAESEKGGRRQGDISGRGGEDNPAHRQDHIHEDTAQQDYGITRPVEGQGGQKDQYDKEDRPCY